MEPINGVGQTAYPMTVQPQEQEMVEDYSSMPMVYDEEIAEKKSASSNMLGMTALGAIALGGLIYGGLKGNKAGKLVKEVEALKTEKADLEAIKSDLEKQLADATAVKEKKNIFKRMGATIKGWFSKKPKDGEAPKADTPDIPPAKD